MVYCRRILFIFFIIFFILTSVCFGATVVDSTDVKEGVAVQYDNSYLTLYNMQHNTQSEFINYCYSHYKDPLVTKMLSMIYSGFGTYGYEGKFMTITEPVEANKPMFIVYFSFLNNCTPSVSNFAASKTVGFANVPLLSGTFYNGAEVYSDNILFPDRATYINGRPLAWCQCVHEGFPQLFKDFGLIDSVEDYTNSLSNIKSAIDTTNTIMKQVDSTIKTESDKIQDSIQSSTNTIADTLTDNDVSDIDVSGIQSADTTEDITSEGFDNIFTSIQNAVLDDSEHSVDITIPFINMPLTISKSSIFGNFSGLSVIENLCSMVWYFLVSAFIVKDISKKINAIKSGNIENVQNTNIKEDLL